MYKVQELMNDSVSSHLPVKWRGAAIFSSLVLTGVETYIALGIVGLDDEGKMVVTEEEEYLLGKGNEEREQLVAA